MKRILLSFVSLATACVGALSAVGGQPLDVLAVLGVLVLLLVLIVAWVAYGPEDKVTRVKQFLQG